MSELPQESQETTTTETQTTETETTEQASPEASSLLGETTPAPFDPEKLTLPEGFEKGEFLDKFSTLATEAGLSGEAAQKLINLHGDIVKSFQGQVEEAWKAQNDKWQAEVKADKEIGGEKLAGIRQTFAKVVDDPALTDPGFREALDFTGAGNHPAIVRTLARWAKALSEGGPVQGGVPQRNARGDLVNGQRSAAEILYGPDGPKTGGPAL